MATVKLMIETEIFEQCETHDHLQERETFWQHRLKSLFPISLNEKEEYINTRTYLSYSLRLRLI